MAVVRTLRSRGANIVVEAHGEVLFSDAADIGRFKRRFSQRIRTFTAAAAPGNTRPRWGHYGKPLKQTFVASTRTRLTRGGGFFYIGVGSTAPYSTYVDQGTGIYAGKAPYPAKILPPWERGEASLYEAAWHPGKSPVSPVMIKGQKGQFFFDQGLKRAFQSMRLRSVQVPGEGIGAMAGAMSTFPSALENFVGNTPNDAAFRASLAEWRAWRDAAWLANPRETLGRGHRSPGGLPYYKTVARRAALEKARQDRIERQRRYQASKQAAAQRAEDQRRRLAEEKKRRAEGEKKRRERARAEALRLANSRERSKAMAFYKKIRRQYPNAFIGHTTLSDGVEVWRVVYTTESGDRVVQQWAFGYDV